MTRLVFIDIETSGLNRFKHAIIQIGAVAVDHNLEAIDAFDRRIKFKEENADPAALIINGYDRDLWDKEGVKPKDAANDFAKFLREYADVDLVSKRGKPYTVAQLAGHNADRFDGPFLQEWYKRLDQFLPASYRLLCTYQRAMWYFLERQITAPADFKLTTLCEYFDIPLDNAHDALHDVRATLELYRRLTKEQGTP